jgi:hypothetical protein
MATAYSHFEHLNMNTFELNQTPVHRLDSNRIWDALARESWDPRQKTTVDDTGRFKVRENAKGTVVYFQDDKTEWESKDGKNWSRRGSKGTHNFEGSVKASRDGTITVTNDDTGVKFECKKDGTTTRSINTKDGITHSITSDSSGKSVSTKIGDKEWTSKDGGKSWQRNGGPLWKGTVDIDKFGRYVEKTASGQTTVRAQSSELAKLLEKQETLEKDWGVKFAKPGETIAYGGQNFEISAPTLKEMRALETVLYRNQQMNLKNVRFAFVQAGPNTDGTSLWGAYQRGDNSGQVVLMPKHSEAKGWQALEGTIEHELVHHEQYENWGSTEWGSATAPEFTKELNAKMGWRRDITSARNVLSDKDNKEWVRDDGGWVQLLNGKPNPKVKLTNEQMQQIAKVRPSTTYFTNPGEMHAEAMAMLRMERRMLYQRSPELYETCKNWDQELINKSWSRQNGKPAVIRNEKGELVPATAESVDAVKQAEERWNREMQPPAPELGDRRYAAANENRLNISDAVSFRLFSREDREGWNADRPAHRGQCGHCLEIERRMQETHRVSPRDPGFQELPKPN